MIEFVLALTISGHLDNRDGAIGAVISHSSHGISRIVKNSPAETYGLQKGDIIVSANGDTRLKQIIGEPYTYVDLVVKRGTETFERKVFRLPVDEIYGQRVARSWKVKDE